MLKMLSRTKMYISSIRARNGIFTVLIFLSLLLLHYQWRHRIIYRAAYGFRPISQLLSKHPIDTKEQIRLWRSLEYLLTNNPPGIPRPPQAGSIPEIKWKPEEHHFEELITMTEEEIKIMKAGHDGFVKGMRVHDLEPVYNKGTRGIVCTAGGSYLPLVVITLRMLARLGTTLPMEVFLEAGEEYESHICEEVLPVLNARCVILAEILNTAPHPRQIGHFQLKIFSIMFSSFEEVLFLDADSLPVQDPTKLFKSTPFRKTGMVTWPDFWYVTPSKHYFSISGTDQPANSARQATESGQLLISKKSHWKTLLMASYYNYWGPEHYYPLLAQGGAGEGDKETFLPAARVVGEPFYQVSEKVVAIGTGPEGTDEMLGNSMIQFDPRDDYALTSQGIFRSRTKPASERKPSRKSKFGKHKSTSEPSTTLSAPSPRPFFIHINLIKFNPKSIYDDTLILRWGNGSYRRAWTKPPNVVGLLDIDAERMYFEEAKWVACNLEHRFRDWFGTEDICAKAERHWEEMYEGKD